MIYSLLADAVLLLHAAFIAFAAFGGLLALRRPNVIWLHLPTLAWGVVVQWADLICPLTPLENLLRSMGGEGVYSGAFIEHYLTPLLYPALLTLELRYLLGALLIVINAGVYVLVLRRRTGSAGRRSRRA